MICQHCEDSGLESNEDGTMLRVCPNCNTFYGNYKSVVIDDDDFEWKEIIGALGLAIAMLVLIALIFCL